MFDLPATVNKILGVTGAKQLFFVGYSQGGLIGYTQLVRDPDLASKVKLFVALAPSVYLDAIKGPFRLLAHYSKDIDVSSVTFFSRKRAKYHISNPTRI